MIVIPLNTILSARYGEKVLDYYSCEMSFPYNHWCFSIITNNGEKITWYLSSLLCCDNDYLIPKQGQEWRVENIQEALEEALTHI